MYLSVVPICGEPTAPQIDGTGTPFEFAVKMRRFDETGLLSQIAEHGQLTAEMADDLAESVADFHTGISRAGAGSVYGRSRDIRQDALDNFSTIRDLAGDAPKFQAELQRLRSWTVHEADRLEEQLEARRRHGFIRECHGDLHLGNIVELAERPCLFDGIEFNERLRWIDVISDIAFLVMDLEEHGECRLARRLLNRYLERTGDYAGLNVLPFYLVYRAMVRAKVDMIRLQEERHSASQGVLLHEFGKYLKIATRDAEPKRPALIIMHGLSGSGKTSLSQRILENSDAIRIRSDIERKRILGISETERSVVEYGTGMYSKDANHQTYDQLESLSTRVIQAGYPVILDAAFLNAETRTGFRNHARSLGVPFRIVACTASVKTLAARVERRMADNRDASDAGVAVLRKQLQADTHFSHEPSEQLITVNTANEASIREALAKVAQVVSEPPRA